MFLVGLTGGVAAGKSSAANIFRELGVPIIDADAIARDVVEPGEAAYYEIKKTFGSEVIDETSGKVDRDALRKIILESSDARRRLNAITHPRIRRKMVVQIIGCLLRGNQYAILDVPLLYETGGWLLNILHKVVVVICERDLQLQRLMETRHLSERESILLIDTQMAPEDKAARASYVIENSGNEEDLRQQVLDIHKELRASKFQWKIRLGVGFVLGTVVGGILLAISQMIPK